LHGDTIRKHTAELPRDGRGRMNSALALRLLPLGNGDRNGDAPITHSEALRRLAIAKTKQVDLQNEITRKERIPLEDVAEITNHCFMEIAGIIKASGLPITAVNEIFDQLRAVGERFPAAA
jgi:hypothetical protein